MSTTKRILTLIFFSSSLSASLDVTRTSMSFDMTTQASSGELFVASSLAPEEGDKSYAISLPVIAADDAQGGNEVTLVPLVPSTTQVNGTTTSGYPLLEANPLYDTNLYWLSAHGTMPIAVAGAAADSAHTVAMITDSVAGRTVLTNSKNLTDSNGKATTSIKGAVAGDLITKTSNPHLPITSQTFVFAAVTPGEGDSNFEGQDGAGIAVLQKTNKGLVPLDAQGMRASPKAAPLPNSTVEIAGSGSINALTAMHWDATLQRLYLGFDLSGGAGVAVVVGELASNKVANSTNSFDDETKLTLRPIIFDTAGTNLSDNWDNNDYVVAEKDGDITVQQLSTMHTTTGKSYLIAGRNDDKVYAVPLVNEVGLDAAQESLGCLADISNTKKPARGGSDTQLLTTSSVAGQVGAGAAPDNIEHLMVRGDSVYVSCAGGSDESKGIFVSTALFDADGLVRAWSVWERVGGAVRDVFGFSFDSRARARYVSGASSSERTTVHVADWGLGSGNGLWGGVSGSAGEGLVALINKEFESNDGGIEAVRVFNTPEQSYAGWFDTTQQFDNSTVVGLLGRNKCVLAMTTQDGSAVTQDTFDATQHMAVCDLTTDSIDLGMLTCAAVSRSTNAGEFDNEGWLFVGGANGLAVWSKDDGNGWSSTSNLSNVARDNDFRFLELKKDDGTSFSNVRAIQTDANAVYVLENEGLYAISYNQNKFKDDPAVLNEQPIATPLGILQDSQQSLLDFIIIGSHGVLATTAGLWTMADGLLASVTNTVGTDGWQEVYITPGATDSFGVCSQLCFTPGSAEERGGVLYTLNADMSLNIAVVYRVNVPTVDTEDGLDNLSAVGNASTTTQRYTTLLGQLREHFYTDGGYAIDTSSLHHQFAGSSSALLRVLPISNQLSNVDRWVYSNAPELNVQDPNHTIGGIVRDPATGTLLVPGVWGLRVLQ